MATEQRLDLIDRNAFAECLERMTKTAYPNLFPGLLEAIDYVKDFPTIEARPVVHGRWINKTSVIHGHVDYMFVCSACGFVHWDSITDTFDSCSNCDAQMDGGADNGI